MCAERARLAAELRRRLVAAVRGVQLYAPSHPLVTRSITALVDTLMVVHASTRSVAIGIVGDEFVVGDIPIPRAADTMGELIKRLRHAGIERIVFGAGVRADEITQLSETMGSADRGDSLTTLSRLPHIRVGRLQVEQRGETVAGDI